MPNILGSSSNSNPTKYCMLTTLNNPFNPFTNFTEWYNYDCLLGYHTLEYIARIANVSPSLIDAENERIVRDAIYDILRYDPDPNYTLVWNDRPFVLKELNDKSLSVSDENEIDETEE